jgi:hypothetical protein
VSGRTFGCVEDIRCGLWASEREREYDSLIPYIYYSREWLEDESNRNSIDRIIFVTFLDKERICYNRLLQEYFPYVEDAEYNEKCVFICLFIMIMFCNKL